MGFHEDVFSITLSGLDQKRFGYVTAKAFVTNEDDVQKTMEFCARHKVQFLILRCPTSAYNVLYKLYAMNMRLMDTLVYYQLDMQKTSVTLPQADARIRLLHEGEEKQISALAQESFSDYPGHYHLDKKLDSASSNAVYQDWAERSCKDRQVADGVLVSETEGVIAGFLTLKTHADALELVLSGIAKSYQGKGIYYNLICAGIHFARDRGIASVYTSSQVTNVAVQKTWIRCGMEPYASQYTFHHWF